MFIELVQPKIIDNCSTSDRVKIRLGESFTEKNLWINLSFHTKEEARRFFTVGLAAVDKEEKSDT